MMVKKRQSIRLRNYDYASKGVYFVTMCVYGGINLFWEKGEGSNKIKGENMVSPVRLNDIGMMVDLWWQKMFEKYGNEIKMDEYIIMPNHVHGIIKIVGANPRIRPNKSNIKNTYVGVGQYISWFKRMSTNKYIKNVKDGIWMPFEKHFWQRNYYDHIIRDEKDLNRIREYIMNNPLNWKKDKYHE